MVTYLKRCKHYHVFRVSFILSITIVASIVVPTSFLLAQTCDYKATGKPIAYVPPRGGIKITFEDVALKAQTEQTRRELAFTVRDGADAEAEWTIQLASGQALAVRTFLGLIQTANSSGTTSEFDYKKLKALWPLDTGKSVTFKMQTVANRGPKYDSELSLCVRRYETLKIPAGSFETVVIDSYRRIMTATNNLPFDEIFTRYWYAPQFGIYMQRVRAMYSQRREILKQTRRAIKVNG